MLRHSSTTYVAAWDGHSANKISTTYSTARITTVRAVVLLKTINSYSQRVSLCQLSSGCVRYVAYCVERYVTLGGMVC